MTGVEGGTSAVGEFVEMMFRPDNVPIVGMLFLVLFFTFLGFREARRNDELTAQGREDEILNDMQR
jgi:hypothetical protein